jgi:hypothetical protein
MSLPAQQKSSQKNELLRQTFAKQKRQQNARFWQRRRS